MKRNRRQSRETAFALLFEWSFRDEELDDIIQNAAEGRELSVDAFACELAKRAIFNRAHIDERIEHFSDSWKINRLSRVALAVLRLAICEMLYFDDIPVGATINEAVELTKIYSGEEEAPFVNGILGAFQRDRSGQTAKEADPAADEAGY